MSGNNPSYNLKAVVLGTGLSPATLRAWERRYGMPKPQRSPGGHRLYSEYDIEMLKWLAARQTDGLSISRAVEMWRNLKESTQDPLQEFHAPSPVVRTEGGMLEALRKDWISACLDFNEGAAEQSLAQAFAITSLEVVCTEVLQKGLSEMGERWYAGAASVQQEHFASALAMRRLNILFTAAPAHTRSGRILAACPPGEHHEFALLMLAFLLRRRGWEVVYLGANVPLDQLNAAIRLVSPRMILSLAQTLSSAASLREMANYANDLDVSLAFGGGIFNNLPALKNRIPAHFLGEDLAAILPEVELLLLQPLTQPASHPISPEYQETLAKFVAKEAFIVAAVNDALQSIKLDPANLEIANANFTRSIASALALGDIHFLDHSVGWLEGLLGNYGWSPSMSLHYYAAYRLAVQQHLEGCAEPILGWFAKFDQLPG